MKLRNKKTGEVTDNIYVYDGFICVDVWKSDSGTYDTLAELNEEWEDCEPTEPLIKDEKIRKAVRAWAECNCLDSDDRLFLSKPTFDCKILSLEYGMLNFDVYYDDESLCNKKYTITELCGEGK